MVFPGQGSQAVGMLNAYGDIAAVRDVLAEASDVLKQDVAKLISEGPASDLNSTVNTQPVMVTVNVVPVAASGVNVQPVAVPAFEKSPAASPEMDSDIVSA